MRYKYLLLHATVPLSRAEACFLIAFTVDSPLYRPCLTLAHALCLCLVQRAGSRNWGREHLNGQDVARQPHPHQTNKGSQGTTKKSREPRHDSATLNCQQLILDRVTFPFRIPSRKVTNFPKSLWDSASSPLLFLLHSPYLILYSCASLACFP